MILWVLDRSRKLSPEILKNGRGANTEELWGALPVLVLMGDDVQLLTACVQH